MFIHESLDGQCKRLKFKKCCSWVHSIGKFRYVGCRIALPKFSICIWNIHCTWITVGNRAEYLRTRYMSELSLNILEDLISRQLHALRIIRETSPAWIAPCLHIAAINLWGSFTNDIRSSVGYKYKRYLLGAY